MRALPLLCLLTALASASAGVVLNEIHYHPVERPAFLDDGSAALDLTEDVHEFIELHNPDAQPVSLAGWRLTGGIEFLFPAGTTLVPGGFLVVARDPARLAAVPAYQLTTADVLGPWNGVLRNSGDTVRLEDAAGALVDRVQYSPASPWPVGADALGAPHEWTGIDPETVQYRGRSLERVSPTAASNDPANWMVSPIDPGPSPGRPNAERREVPRPVVVVHLAAQKRDGNLYIQAGETVRVEAAFSGTNSLGQVALEWHVEDLNTNAPPTFRQPMWPVGGTGGERFAADVSGPPARSVVRYRILADRGAGLEVVSPRPGDPLRWHAWFMNPVRTTGTNEVYDLFISHRSLDRLRTNISATPRRVTSTGPSGRIRPSWNSTEPATFVHRGRVYDVQMRHHGSQYRREVGRRSYKIQFPDYSPFAGRESVFLTDKDYRTESGHLIFRLASLPTSGTRWVDLYLNNDARLVRLEQDEYDGSLLERYHTAQAGPGGGPEPAGELYKSQGVLNTDNGAFATANGEGPYSAGSGIRLLPRLVGTNVTWPSLDRYAATYTLQNHSWRSHLGLQSLIDGLWQARSNQTRLSLSHPRVTNELRTWILANWDTNAFLTHTVLANWMVFWDDTAHNSLLWQRRNGRWSMLPWDFDTTMDGQGAGGNIFEGQPFAGPNYFKQSLTLALREEFRQAAWLLNNTLLHPDTLAANGVDRRIVTWARSRNPSVNRQLGLTNWTAPRRPAPAGPGPGDFVGPTGTLSTSEYAPGDTNSPSAHRATRWEVRLAGQTWETPHFRRVATNHLVQLSLAEVGLPVGAQAFWRATHVDEQGHESVPSPESRFVFGARPLPDGIRLSELLAENRGAVRNGNDNPDYVELFNPGSDPVSLAGWTLTDDLSRPSQFIFPAQAVVPAGGHLLVWCDRRTAQPGFHSGFGLDNDGDQVALFAPVAGGGGLRLVDLVRFGRQIPNLALARDPGQPSDWVLSSPTPAAPNQPVPVVGGSMVVLNEWLANPASGDDWVELFNPASTPAAIGGLSLSDRPDLPGRSPLPPLSFIAAGEFLRLWADGNLAAGGNHLAFRLGEEGGFLGLARGDGSWVDRVSYGRQTRDRSTGRIPDGGAMFLAAPPTPGSPNGIDANLDGIPDAWAAAYGLAQPVLPGRDTDGDGFPDQTEYRLGTHPRDPSDALVLQARHAGEPGPAVDLDFVARPGRRYRIESRGEAPVGDWTLEFTIEPDTVSQAIRRRLSTGSDAAFFRLVAE